MEMNNWTRFSVGTGSSFLPLTHTLTLQHTVDQPAEGIGVPQTCGGLGTGGAVDAPYCHIRPVGKEGGGGGVMPWVLVLPVGEGAWIWSNLPLGPPFGGQVLLLAPLFPRYLPSCRLALAPRGADERQQSRCVAAAPIPRLSWLLLRLPKVSMLSADSVDAQASTLPTVAANPATVRRVPQPQIELAPPFFIYFFFTGLHFNPRGGI